MINNILTINGSKYEDYEQLKVSRPIGQYNSLSNFRAILDSPYGRHSNDFTIGDDVRVYAGDGVLNGLLVQYRFNISGTLQQDEYETRNGTLNGSAFWINNGFKNGGLAFAGSSTDGAPSMTFTRMNSGINAFGASGTHSISMWANISETASGGGFYSSLVHGGSSAPSFYLHPNGSLIYRLIVNGTQYLVSGAKLSDLNSWNHLATVYDSSIGSAYIYQNGNLVNSLSVGLGSLTTQGTPDATIGRGISNGTTFYCSGILDDFRIYNRALSQSEIQTLYNNGSGTDDFKLFGGILEDIEYNGEGNRRDVTLRGRDYSARLMDVTVQPVVYTNMETGSIIRDIISNNVQNITINNVSGTNFTVPRIAFNHNRVYDAIQDLSDLSNYIFYVDVFKNLHTQPRQSVSQNLNIGSENTKKITFASTREGMANKVWVYGDRQLVSAPRQLFSLGASPGSVLTLTDRPFNTQVQTSNITPGSNLKGGIFDGVSSVSQSGADYLVSFLDRQIIFMSGTSLGYSTLPNANGSVLVNYDKQVPIVKYSQDDVSIALFGPKEDVIIDRAIKDPQTANKLVIQKMQDANPLNQVEANLIGWQEIIPGQTVTMQMNDFGILASGITILEADYNFNPQSVSENNVITLKLSRRIDDVTDTIKSLDRRLTALEVSEAQDTDVLTRIFTDTEQVIVVGSRWTVSTRSLGSSFILGKGYHGVTGATFGGILGSVIASGINFLGDSRGTLSIVASGGNDYSVTGSYNPNAGISGGGFRNVFS